MVTFIQQFHNIKVRVQTLFEKKTFKWNNDLTSNHTQTLSAIAHWVVFLGFSDWWFYQCRFFCWWFLELVGSTSNQTLFPIRVDKRVEWVLSNRFTATPIISSIVFTRPFFTVFTRPILYIFFLRCQPDNF